MSVTSTLGHEAQKAALEAFGSSSTGETAMGPGQNNTTTAIPSVSPADKGAGEVRGGGRTGAVGDNGGPHLYGSHTGEVLEVIYVLDEERDAIGRAGGWN